MVSFLLGITPASERVYKKLSDCVPGRNQPLVVQPRPDILLIGANQSDQEKAILTVTPRGYNLIPAASVSSGLDELRNRADRVGMILLDSRLPRTKEIQILAHAVSPAARVIQLPLNSLPSDLPGILLHNMY